MRTSENGKFAKILFLLSIKAALCNPFSVKRDDIVNSVTSSSLTRLGLNRDSNFAFFTRLDRGLDSIESRHRLIPLLTSGA
jgi:hypothetical protein